jgi:hypothetical protein
MQNHAAEIKLSAERKAGGLLKLLEHSSGGGDRKSEEYHLTQAASSDLSEYRAVLTASAITWKMARRWQQIAELPEQVFRSYIAERQAARDEVTTTAGLALQSKAEVLGRGVFRRVRPQGGAYDPSFARRGADRPDGRCAVSTAWRAA